MKKIWIVLLVLVVVVIGIMIYLKSTKLTDFEPQIKEKLAKLVLDGSKGLYHLEMDTLLVDVVSSNIKLVKAHLRPDTLVYAQMEKEKTAPNDLFDVTIDQIAIEDISPAAFFANKKIDLRRIFINKPVVKVYHKKQPYNLPDTSDAKNIYQQIRKDISSIKVDTLILQNVDFIYSNVNKQNAETRLSNVKIFLSDILIDSTSQNDHSRVLFARNCAVSLKDYKMDTGDSLYRLTIGDIEVQTTLKAITIKTFRFMPRLSPVNFYRQVKMEKDIFKITIEKISLDRINWWDILSEEKISIGHIKVQNGKMDAYRDKRQPVDKRSKLGKFPHQLLMNVSMPVDVDTIAIDNFDIEYTETNPKSDLAGHVIFQNTKGLITNITNIPEEIRKNRAMTIRANTSFLRQAPLSAQMIFDLANAKKGSFKVNAKVGSINAETLNKLTVPMGLVKLNSLNIKSLDAAIAGDNYRAKGTVTMLYDDLAITALKSADDTLKKRRLLSFIANSFIIKKKNPSDGNPIRVVEAKSERELNRSFFNFAWKTILNGTLKTVGYNKK